MMVMKIMEQKYSISSSPQSSSSPSAAAAAAAANNNDHSNKNTLICNEENFLEFVPNTTTGMTGSNGLTMIKNEDDSKPPELSISFIGENNEYDIISPSITSTTLSSTTERKSSNDESVMSKLLMATTSGSNLSVNRANNNRNSNCMVSILSASQQNSSASSINDLNYEVEQLERAIRYNDVKLVSKMLESYQQQRNKNNKNSNNSNDKTNILESNSVLNQDDISQTVRPVLKTQTAFDEQQQQNLDGANYVSLQDPDSPFILSNALHLSIENNAHEVAVLLLKHGINPNKCGNEFSYDYYQHDNSRHTSLDSHEHLVCPTTNNSMFPSISREPLIRSPSIRSANLPLLLNPKTTTKTDQHKLSSTSIQSRNSFCDGSQQKLAYNFMPSYPSSVNSDLFSFSRRSSKNGKLLRIRSSLSINLRTVHIRSDGTKIFYDEEYTREKLFLLPPIFLCVTLNNSVILRELIFYGADVNIKDANGVTPLHLCLCQQHISRACLRLLIQSGAKLMAKNNQNIAPYELANENFSKETMQLQKSIIEDCFSQLFHSKNVKRDSIFHYNKSQNRNNNNNTNKKTTEATSKRIFLTKDDSAESTSAGSNLTRFLESKVMNNNNERKKSTNETLIVNTSNNKSSDQTTLKNTKDETSISTNTVISGNPTIFPISSLSSSRGPKRSFAIESSGDIEFRGKMNLSQSTLQLSSNLGSDSLTTTNNQPNSMQQPPQQQQQQHHSGFGMGARFFGRRRSGDESSKNQLKLAKISLNRTTTNVIQDGKQQQNPNCIQEESSSSDEMMKESIEILNKMAMNDECIPLIINYLQKYLPDIVSLNESTKILSILHNGLSQLLQKLFQSIVENFSTEKDKILSKYGPNENIELMIITAENDDKKLNLDRINLLRLKRQMSTQLCSLLVCVFHCLKGGQTFQYTSLLIVNRIIDSFIRYGTFDMLVDMDQIHPVLEPPATAINNKNSLKQQNGSTSGTLSSNEVTSSDRQTAINSTMVPIVKQMKHLRLDESLEPTQHPQQQQPQDNWTRRENDKNKHVNSRCQNNKMAAQGESNTSNLTCQSKNLISWVKSVHLSPKIKQQTRLKLLSETLKHKTIKNGRIDTAEQSIYMGIDKSSNLISKRSDVQTFIMILVRKGLDLLLNVLNNAITLHKRFSESKQLCVPSRRSRQCLYHCLQILSARAILYTSQNDDAQKRLIQEGPLKVLMSSIDSTNDPQLICLTLQTIANISLNPVNHQRLVESNMADALMQLILPSDEWFYTNHSTKYAKFVKHQAARIMVYMGLEKRLRNKVFLFDLMDDFGWHSPAMNSTEDRYIIKTSIAPSVVYSGTFPPILIGCSIENIIMDMVQKIEEKMINGEDSLCIDPLNEEPYWLGSTAADNIMTKDPPAIQVDMPSGLITNHRNTNHPNCFFYLSTLPMSFQPIIVLRVLQHRMFGSVTYWAWQGTSRASVASSGASSYEYNRSRANSNASNCNFDKSNLRNNIDWHCSNFSLSPSRIDSTERRLSARGLPDSYRLTPQNSFPLGAKSVPMADCLSIGRNNSLQLAHRLSIQRSSIQRASLVEQQIKSYSECDSQMSFNRLQQSLPIKNYQSHSVDGGSSSTSTHRNNSIDTSELNEAFIISFQKELQNLPKSPVMPTGDSQMAPVNSLTAYIRETFENVSNSNERPRSCSDPRITFENFPTIPLHFFKNQVINQTEKSQLQQQQQLNNTINPMLRSRNSSADISSNAQIFNFGTNPTLSPLKRSIRNLNESPNSCASTFRTASSRSCSRSGSRSGSTCQVINEWIMPNAHKAILKLILDWINICSDDFHQVTFRRELVDFLNRVSMMGEQYRWICDEIRLHAMINEREIVAELPSADDLINQEYISLQKLILNGQLPCSKEEAVVLAVIQLRIEETSPPTDNQKLGKEAHQDDNNADHTDHNNSIGSLLATTTSLLHPNSIIESGDGKLRSICENVKENPTNHPEKLYRITPSAMSSSFDEIDEEENEEGIKDGKDIFKIDSNLSSSFNQNQKQTDCSNSSNRNNNNVQSLTKKTTTRILQWMSSSWNDREYNFSSIDARRCLPPIYQNSKNIAKTIKEQKRKLFHTSVYESEQQLKKLYIQTCKRLPAYGCRLFQVKELLHGRTNRRATRLLGICLDRIVLLDCNTLQLAKTQPTTNLQQWRAGGGRAHDRLVLEFRGTQWSFITTSHNSLRAIGTVLWEILQSLDSTFLDTLMNIESQYESCSKEKENMKLNDPQSENSINRKRRFREELLLLESMLHFPEEVALCLGKVEYELFFSIQPVHFIRQVTLNLSSGTDENNFQQVKNHTVKDLIERFHEVSSWVTQLIISQPTHEMRKAVLSCIMRVVQTCWNLGNFNSAVEIMAGLKSEKLKPFWLSIERKDDLSLCNKLARILLSSDEPSEEYKRAVVRALDIPHSQVIPFFGAFLSDLKNVLKNVPSLIVLSNENNVRRDSVEVQSPTPKIDTISDYNGENNYMSRIGVGGIINMDKMYKAHQVLDNLRAFHIHSIRRNRLLSSMNQQEVQVTSSIDNRSLVSVTENPFEKNDSSETSVKTNSQLNKSDSTEINSTKILKKEDESLYMIDMGSYNPIQLLPRSHGVSLISLDSRFIDHHVLQAMHHGMSIIHYEEDTGRSSIVYLQLEQSNSMIAWGKPFWSTSLKLSGNTSQDYQLSLDIEDYILPAISLRYETAEPAVIGLEEGFIDLMFLKDVFISPTNVDLSMIGRRHGFLETTFIEQNHYSVKLLFGLNLSDNRTTEFIAPKMTLSIWVEGLRSVLQLIQNQKKLIDQRIVWLKEKYLQSYYEESSCQGPTPAEAIRIFGGRKWTVDAMGSSHQSLQTDASTNKFNSASKSRKKKTTNSFSVNRELSNRSQLSINSEPGSILLNCRNDTSTFQNIKSNISSQSQDLVKDSFISLITTSSSSENRNKFIVSNQSPIHTSFLTSNYREKYCKRNISTILDAFGGLKVPNLSPQKPRTINSGEEQRMAITHSSNLSFFEFSELFRSFLTCIRRDIKDIFEQIASRSDVHAIKENKTQHFGQGLNQKHQKKEMAKSSSEQNKTKKFLGLLTRNSPIHFDENFNKNRVFDAISAASIVTNSAGIESLNTSVLNASDFQSFLKTYQCESLELEEVNQLIEKHEPNLILRKRSCLSFEGFARYLMDKDNFAYLPELFPVIEDDMDYPMSHYYIATSHNTYLTGHQLKGESSVELYSQVLLTGCRCVELDCWDGDDGMPVIYHGHTLTSKIPFKKVVETINAKAFVASPYPVILSLENHCSLQQQAKMAQIFLSVFGEKLVTKFLFESDYTDDPRLPSPNQLKYRILIKNKKLRAASLHVANPKVRLSLANSKAINGRANSLVSNTSTGSFNDEDDDDYEDDDDDDEVEESLPFESIEADKKSMEKEYFKSPRHNKNQTESHEQTDSPLVHNKVARKSSSQIAPELSDLVIYCQAIKFRGINSVNSMSLSPTSSSMATPISKKVTSRKISGNTSSQLSQNLLSVLDPIKNKEDSKDAVNLSPTYQPANTNWTLNKRPNSSALCYQVASINENTAKKLCRKTPLSVVSHTENQVMRTYPTGMRIDSSNFNPVIFWAFGIQSVALNYQTVDMALQINSAMFEQNGGCGYVLKSKVMRDRTHMMYGRFNPWDKEFDGLHTINVSITIISGQYVCPNTNTGSPQLEAEIIGIPIDCNRQRSKIVQRNSLNPIWNDTFRFKIRFVDLAFLRITVNDVASNQMSAQLTLPIKCLRPGYRHLRLRNPQNQSLPLSTLFIYSNYEEEGLDIQSGATEVDQTKSGMSKIDLNKLDSGKIDVAMTVPVKRRMFFLVVHGVIPEEPSTILKITQDSTVKDVITQALTRANKPNGNIHDYVLIEEVNKGWEKTRGVDRNAVTQRILELHERPLEAQNNWKGEGKLILKKLADDPSTRAWMTTIRSTSANKERSQSSDKEVIGDWEDKRDENETFLVCIYNVSKDQPYTILKAPIKSTSQDIISHVMHKAHRDEDPKSLVLVEEIESFIDSSQGESSKPKSCIDYRRVVEDQENIYDVQTRWKNKGKFELKYRADITSNDNTQDNLQSTSKGIKNHRGSLKKLSKMHRTYSKRFQQRKESNELIKKSSNTNEQGEKPLKNPIIMDNIQTRQVHSDGEVQSDIEEKSEASNNSFRRLKKLSLKRLKAWK